jgi:hypothetical protein
MGPPAAVTSLRTALGALYVKREMSVMGQLVWGGEQRKATFAARIDLDIALGYEGICHLLRPLEGLGLQSLEVRTG